MTLVARVEQRAAPRGFRKLDGGGHSENPPATLTLEVWRVANRLAQSDQQKWRTGVRLGLNADGSLDAPLADARSR